MKRVPGEAEGAVRWQGSYGTHRLYDQVSVSLGLVGWFFLVGIQFGFGYVCPSYYWDPIGTRSTNHNDPTVRSPPLVHFQSTAIKNTSTEP